jgi:3-oxoacyl-[acyl-carrier-protein] synthase II
MENLNKRQRVVVTGMGMVSPVGNSVAEAWQNASAGKSGIALINRFDTSELGVHFAGEVKELNIESVLNHRESRRTDRVSQLAIVAATEAMNASGLIVTEDNRYDVGCLVGTGIGGIETMVEAGRILFSRGVKAIKPLTVPMSLPDGPASLISMHYNLRGPVFSISTACATGNNCIGEATRIIQRGTADVMLAGSAEAAVMDLCLASFNNMNALSRRNDEPEKASRPFDSQRDGFVIAEGAAVLVLENLEHALARGATIYAEIAGYSNTSDAYHVTAPLETGDSAAKAMEFALHDAQITPEAVDYINAHGTSTVLNDKSETRAIKQAFGNHAYEIPISSTKSVTGHLMAGAGAIEAVFSIMAMQNNFVPPTINLDNPDPECDLDYTPHVGKSHPINYAMSNSFGFGGHNAVIVFRKYTKPSIAQN